MKTLLISIAFIITGTSAFCQQREQVQQRQPEMAQPAQQQQYSAPQQYQRTEPVQQQQSAPQQQQMIQPVQQEQTAPQQSQRTEPAQQQEQKAETVKQNPPAERANSTKQKQKTSGMAANKPQKINPPSDTLKPKVNVSKVYPPEKVVNHDQGILYRCPCCQRTYNNPGTCPVDNCGLVSEVVK
ncbi:MAG TPA: hypothetical protein VNY36_07695 [Bacteroidia bacterium]|jgi:hypothetical protein|nr:hypothetical protein [Bacteroidia bacterium]